MKITLENQSFTHSIETSDWRYSSALLGLERYLSLTNKPYELKGDALYYNEKDINEDDYWKVVDEYYSDINFFKSLSNKIILNKIESSDLVKVNREMSEHFKKVDLTIVNYNEMLEFFCTNTSFTMDSREYKNCLLEDKEMGNKLKKWNCLLHEYLKTIKISLTDSNDELLKILNFLYPHTLKSTFFRRIYSRFIDPSKFFTKTGKVCRLNGYNVDMTRKSRSLGYNFNKENFVCQDIQEFDFIPFAFIGDFKKEITTFFINNNIKAASLIKVRNDFEMTVQKYSDADNSYTTTQLLFLSLLENNANTLNDLEIICNTGTNFKDVSNNMFHTVLLRKRSVNILEEIKDFYHKFNYGYEISKDNWIRVDEVVTNAILNNLVLDDLITLFLKALEGPLNEKSDTARKKASNEIKPSRMRLYWVIKYLIDTNLIIKYGNSQNIKERLRSPIFCAKTVLRVMDSKKVSVYRSKLTYAIATNDYDTFVRTAMQLSEHSKMRFDFLYELLREFEVNKDLAYSFIHTLSSDSKKDKEEIEI